MSPIDEPASFDSKAAAEARKSKAASATPEQPTSPELVAFTIDAASGRIVNVERVDAGGAHHELSESERARLGDANATLAHVVEQAFEAGIACVLGDEAGDPERPESQEDAELSRMLLQSLMARTAIRRLMQRDVLSRAIIGTLIEHAADERAATH